MPVSKKPAEASSAPRSRLGTAKASGSPGTAMAPGSPIRASGSPGLSRAAASSPASRGASRAQAPSVDARRTPTPAPTATPCSAPPPTMDDYAVPVREVVKPPGQLALEEKELAEDVGRMLTAANPSAPVNLVRFSQREHSFRSEPLIDQLLHHLSLEGCLMHNESDEAAKEKHRREAAAFAAVSRRVTAQSRRISAQVQSRRTTIAQGSGEPAPAGAHRALLAGEHSLAGVVAALLPEASCVGGPAAGDEEGAKALRNQFNFTDRGAGTGQGPARSRSTMTEAPPTTSSGGSYTRWEIFDAYIEDQERQRQREEIARLKAQAARRGGASAAAMALAGVLGDPPQKSSSTNGSATGSSAVLQGVLCVVERMVQQNLFKDVAMDFKYWDDPADAVRQQEGTLLPLWGFTSPRIKGRAVTALAWSPRYFDLFAAGYGSYDFLAPTTGLVVAYSLKSPAQPERCFPTPAGVLCLDFHPEHPNLLAVGCQDGSVLVFDMGAARAESQGPLYVSTPANGKHSEPVWQVCWQRTDSHELQFVSVSSDGRVTLWSVSKNELSFRDLMVLRQLSNGMAPSSGASSSRSSGTGDPAELGLPSSVTAGGAASADAPAAQVDEEGEEELAGPVGLAGGCCFDFHRQQDYLFVVGTEEGALYKCSTASTSHYLGVYGGHRLPVYAVRWNAQHPRAFLSGSADWSVKLWDTLHPRPVMSFDLGSPVGDVAWAPFSSTVFAAATESGRVHVFDLAQSRAGAVCVQRVVKKARLTRLAFNAHHPVLLAGDDKGGITCFKLSPNLRRSLAVPSTAAGGSGGASGSSNASSNGKAAAAPVTPAGTGAAQLSSTITQRGGGSLSAEAARLEAVLQVARKCNAALTAEDWELLC